MSISQNELKIKHLTIFYDIFPYNFHIIQLHQNKQSPKAFTFGGNYYLSRNFIVKNKVTLQLQIK